MILYTTVPEELIFPHENSTTNQIVVDIKEGQLILEQVSNQQLKVVRLISSDPNAYLNENYSPGRMISLF
ncbi:YlzJ-like family protein [Anaerobacillus sp. CMMVII]|uniref:YlzJ-like family protein n=1 Tax=Anaerobacillus sp. CMMVII TaxID=2755588 RepID=UPI0021B7AAE1|nr:YlzJ-like family protein [Anaerobacillus sp. CMMVII]MCT8139874.1 YlzJ-like family protein [Anaerobacillus sp. CMMVII]